MPLSISYSCQREKTATSTIVAFLIFSPYRISRQRKLGGVISMIARNLSDLWKFSLRRVPTRETSYLIHLWGREQRHSPVSTRTENTSDGRLTRSITNFVRNVSRTISYKLKCFNISVTRRDMSNVA